MLTTLNQGLLNVVSIVIRLVITVSHKHLNSCYGVANIGNAKVFFAFIKVVAELIEKLNVESESLKGVSKSLVERALLNGKGCEKQKLAQT